MADENVSEAKNGKSSSSTVGSTVKTDLGHLKKLDPQRKALLAAIIFILFILSIVVGAYLSKGSLNSGSLTGNESVDRPERASTTLSLSPEEATMAVGDTQDVSVVLGSLPVSAIDVYIEYDPEVFTAAAPANGDVFDRVIINNVEDGVIQFSAAVSAENATNLREGTVMTFQLTALKTADSSAVTFDTNKTTTGLNGDNTLGLTTGALYTVQ